MFFGPRDTEGKLGRSYRNLISYAEVFTKRQDPKPLVRQISRRLLENNFRTGQVISQPKDPHSFREFGRLEVEEEALPYVNGEKGKYIALSIHGEGDFECLPKAAEIFNAKGTPRRVIVTIGPQHPSVEKKLEKAFGKSGIEIASTRNQKEFLRKCLGAFKENGGVVLHADKNTIEDGIVVNIFGKETKFPAGIFGLAQKHDLAIIPFFTYIDEAKRVCVRIDKPIPPGPPNETAQAFAERVEIACRLHPDQVFGFMEKELREARR